MKNNRILLSLIIFSCLFTTGCKPKKVSLENKFTIVCTIFPEYDWVQNITGQNNYDVINKLIIKGGLDIHHYIPSDYDAEYLKNCDLFIYNGGESENWVQDLITNSNNPKMETLCLMDFLKDDLINKDEHIWLSIKNAVKCVEKITEILITKNPENKETYEKNAEGYIAELNLLDKEYSFIRQEKPILICDKFPFTYLFNDYNLSYYCVEETCVKNTVLNDKLLEDKFAQIIDDNNLANVYKLETSDNKFAQKIIYKSNNPRCNILTLDSLQSTTLSDSLKGKSYTGTMKKNLEEIKKTVCIN